MSTIRNRLYPLRDADAHDKISLYSMDVTGVAGALVKATTGSCNPSSITTDGFGATPVGVNYNGTYSNRYETFWKATNTVSGDTRYNALGFTEKSTLEYDELGRPLKYEPQLAKAIGAVVSGETVPILKKSSIMGIWGNFIDTTTSPVQPGHLVVVSRSGNGLIASADPNSATAFRSVSNTGGSFIYEDKHVIGKWLSSLPTTTQTGAGGAEFAAQGGYAFFTFDLNR